MTSPVDLCNLALDRISARSSITGINPPSPPNNLAAQVASRNYQTQVDAVFRAANWNSARKQAPLTLLKARFGTPENPSGALPQPPFPWLYEYAWPNDCLKFRFVIPTPNLPTTTQPPLTTGSGYGYFPRANTSMPFVPAIDTDANNNQVKVVLTNAARAQGVYTARIDDVDLWDAQLQNAVIGALAAWFCPPITGDDKKTAMQIQVAVGLLNAARMADGNEGISNVDIIPDWMNIRSTGSSFWGAEGGPFMSGYYNSGAIGGGYDSWGAPNGLFY